MGMRSMDIVNRSQKKCKLPFNYAVLLTSSSCVLERQYVLFSLVARGDRHRAAAFRGKLIREKARDGVKGGFQDGFAQRDHLDIDKYVLLGYSFIEIGHLLSEDGQKVLFVILQKASQVLPRQAEGALAHCLT